MAARQNVGTRLPSRRSFLIGMGAAVGGGLALSACGTGTDSSSSGRGSSGGEAGEGVHFTSWVFGQQGSGPLEEVVSTFTTSTGTKVRKDSFPYEDTLNQLVIKGRSGNLRGIAHIDQEWLSSLATADLIQPLSNVVDNSLFPKNVQDAGLFNGDRYGYPWTQSAIGMIGNNKLHREMGIDLTGELTPDEFLESLRQIKKRDPSLVPYAPSTSVKQLKDIIPWILAFGGTVFDGEQVTLGDQGSIDAISYWRLLLDEELIQPGMDRDAARQLFAQEKAVIYDDAPQAIGIIPGLAQEETIVEDMRPIQRPVTASGIAASNLVWSQPLVAFSLDGEEGDLMSYLSTDDDALRVMFEEGGQPPTTLSALESDWFAGNQFYEEWTTVVAANSSVNPLWNFPTASAAQTSFDEGIEELLLGNGPLKQGLEALSEELEALL